MYNKIKLYHYSNKNIKDKLSIKYYGENYFTANDLKATNVKRIFFYLEPRPLEQRFKGSQYLYTAEILRSRLYDLRADLRGYKSQYNIITELLQAIKQRYNGVIYNSGGIDIVNLFYDTKIKDCKDLTRI